MKSIYFYTTLIFCLLTEILLLHPKKKQFRLNDAESYLNAYIIKNNDKTVIGNKITFKLSFIRASHFYDKKFSITRSVLCELWFKTKQEFNFLLKDERSENFIMPNEDPFPYDHNEESKTKEILDLNNDYSVEIEQKPFSITILRSSTKELLFSTKNFPLIFMNDYLELTTKIPSKYLFGFGERSFKFKLESGIYSMYNRDQYAILEDRKGGNNLYGSHPMYLMREVSGNYHVVYLRNSLPMDVIIDMEELTLKYKILGGIFDFNFFIGDKSPETSVKLYHNYLNGFSMPPFWSMGFHQSRWGYESLRNITNVLKNYRANNIPLDTIWSDIDYMYGKQPFTINTEEFPIKEFRETLKTYKKRWVMIAEPAISVKEESSELLREGDILDVFIKNAENDVLFSWVWPGKVNFIDFFHKYAEKFWNLLLKGLHNQIPFSGIWLDMNELATFTDGQNDPKTSRKMPCNDKTNYVFLPGKKPLESNTICPNALHRDGAFKHFHIHNFFPVEHSRLSYKFLENQFPDEYPFVLTRANAPGFGRWANHWSGDNKSTYQFLKLSITLTFQFNIFGNPFTGSDICGFGDNPKNEALCAKWYQMGSLYPFSRSHSHNESKRKEPYVMTELLLETTKKSLQFRYSILKYYYSLFLSANGEGTIFKPLFFVFYEDEILLEESIIDSQFMIGEDLMVAPIIQELFWDRMKEYFPKGDWFDLRDYTKVIKDPTKGSIVTVEGRLKEMPPVFLRAGKTIPIQNADKVYTTDELDNNFNLVIALSHDKNDSLGFIPALKSYNSKSKSNICLGGACFIEIKSEFNPASKELDVVITPPKKVAEDKVVIQIKKFRIMNIDTSLYKFKESSIDSLINGGFLKDEARITVNVINKYVLDIVIEGTFIIDLEKTQSFKVNFE